MAIKSEFFICLSHWMPQTFEKTFAAACSMHGINTRDYSWQGGLGEVSATAINIYYREVTFPSITDSKQNNMHAFYAIGDFIHLLSFRYLSIDVSLLRQEMLHRVYMVASQKGY